MSKYKFKNQRNILNERIDADLACVRSPQDSKSRTRILFTGVFSSPSTGSQGLMVSKMTEDEFTVNHEPLVLVSLDNLVEINSQLKL